MLLASLTFTGSAVAAPQPPANREPYELAIRCFLANRLAARSRQKQGDQAGAAAYDAKGKTAFGVAGIMGEVLGYSTERVNQDMQRMMEPEMARMMNEPGYFKSVAAACKAAELM